MTTPQYPGYPDDGSQTGGVPQGAGTSGYGPQPGYDPQAGSVPGYGAQPGYGAGPDPQQQPGYGPQPGATQGYGPQSAAGPDYASQPGAVPGYGPQPGMGTGGGMPPYPPGAMGGAPLSVGDGMSWAWSKFKENALILVVGMGLWTVLSKFTVEAYYNVNGEERGFSLGVPYGNYIAFAIGLFASIVTTHMAIKVATGRPLAWGDLSLSRTSVRAFSRLFSPGSPRPWASFCALFRALSRPSSSTIRCTSPWTRGWTALPE